MFSFDLVRWLQLRQLRSQSVLLLSIQFVENASEALCFVFEFGFCLWFKFIIKVIFFLCVSVCGCIMLWESLNFCTFFGSISWGEVSGGDQKALEWKRLNSKELGISTSMITKPTRKVLNGLKRKGKHLAYSWF